MKQRQLTAVVIAFHRHSADEPAEFGVFVGKDESDTDGIILDMDGKVVADVWMYVATPIHGCIVVRDTLVG